MKKALGILLAVVMTLSLLSGCGEKEMASLHILVDIEYANDLTENNLKNDMDLLLKSRLVEYCARKGVERPKDIVIEYLPTEGIERENALTRLRTEVMAGEGPDLFLIYCNEKDPLLAEEAIFTMPEKAMELSIFMTLDDYMENNTHFAEWDKMNQTVLAAGRTKEGQQVIPLCYRIPASVYRKSEAEHTPSKEITWMDMLESEDEVLSASTVWLDNTTEVKDGKPFMMLQTPMTEFMLGSVADYHEEELLFTEEELKQRLAEILDLAERYTEGEFEDAPVHYNTYLGYAFSDEYSVRDLEGKVCVGTNGIEWNEPHTLVPLYSDDGGVTAEISAYAAINRNAKNPDHAFLVLDYLSSYEAQRSERIYVDCLYKKFGGTYMYGTYEVEIGNIPMYDTLMSEEERVYFWAPNTDLSMQGWYLPDESFAAFCAVRDQITHVRFRNAIDLELTQIYRDYHDAIRFGGAPDEVVATGYRRMQQMLRE